MRFVVTIFEGGRMSSSFFWMKIQKFVQFSTSVLVWLLVKKNSESWFMEQPWFVLLLRELSYGSWSCSLALSWNCSLYCRTSIRRSLTDSYKDILKWTKFYNIGGFDFVEATYYCELILRKTFMILKLVYCFILLKNT